MFSRTAFLAASAFMILGFQNCGVGEITLTDGPVANLSPTHSAVEEIEVDLPGSIDDSEESVDYVKMCQNLQASESLTEGQHLYLAQGPRTISIGQASMVWRARGTFHFVDHDKSLRAKISVLQEAQGEVLACNVDFDDITQFDGRLVLVNSSVGRIINSRGSLVMVGSKVHIINESEGLKVTKQEIVGPTFLEHNALTDAELKQGYLKICEQLPKNAGNSVVNNGTLLNPDGYHKYLIQRLYALNFQKGDTVLLGAQGASRIDGLNRIEGRVLICHAEVGELRDIRGDVIVVGGNVGKLFDLSGTLTVINGSVGTQNGNHGQIRLLN